MADTKVTGLDALTVPADVDLLYIVDDPAGLPIGKKITVGNLLARAYGSMYVLRDGRNADIDVAGDWHGGGAGCGQHCGDHRD